MQLSLDAQGRTRPWETLHVGRAALALSLCLSLSVPQSHAFVFDVFVAARIPIYLSVYLSGVVATLETRGEHCNAPWGACESRYLGASDDGESAAVVVIVAPLSLPRSFAPSLSLSSAPFLCLLFPPRVFPLPRSRGIGVALADASDA